MATARRSSSRTNSGEAARAGGAGDRRVMVGPLLAEPRRVGKPLQRELEGYWSARRGAYRLVYRIDDEANTVRVVRVDHRADVYRPG